MKIKNISILIIISLILFFSLINISFWYIKNQTKENIYNTFYFNDNYIRDKIQLLNDFENKNIKIKQTIKKCLYDIAPKYFYTNNFQKQYCIYQIKELLLDLKHPLYKRFPYIANNEKRLFLNHGKNIIDSILLKYVDKKDKSTQILKESIKNKNELWYINNIPVRKIILKYFYLMDKDYYKEFWKHIILNSWYRSIKEQKQIYDSYIKRYWVNQKYATIPWFSEHHIWTAIDIKKYIIYNKEWKFIVNNYSWLKKNSWKYWFIQSYNQNCLKFWINNEDWHYRWIWTIFSNKWKIWNYNNSKKCNIVFLKELKNR